MPLLARQQYEAEHRRLQALPLSPELQLREHPLAETSLRMQNFHPDNNSSTALKVPGMSIGKDCCGGLLPRRKMPRQRPEEERSEKEQQQKETEKRCYSL